MDEQTTAEMKQQQSGRGKMSHGPIKIQVAVTPDQPNGKSLNIQAAGPNKYVQPNGNINLDPGESYEINFILAGANGVNSWDVGNPFDNQAGQTCPVPGQGASPPFSVQPGASQNSMTVNVSGQSSGSQATYRLNFNDSYYCDPIIVVN